MRYSSNSPCGTPPLEEKDAALLLLLPLPPAPMLLPLPPEGPVETALLLPAPDDGDALELDVALLPPVDVALPDIAALVVVVVLLLAERADEPRDVAVVDEPDGADEVATDDDDAGPGEPEDVEEPSSPPDVLQPSNTTTPSHPTRHVCTGTSHVPAHTPGVDSDTAQRANTNPISGPCTPAGEGPTLGRSHLEGTCFPPLFLRCTC